MTCGGRAFEARRDLAILLLLIDTGMRRGEVASVQCDDLDLDQSLLRVMGKGGRERLVPLGRKLVQALDRYLRVRLLHEYEEAASLFLGRAGPITPSGVYQIVRNQAREAGIRNVHPRQLRRSFAHAWLVAGGAGDGSHACGWLAQSRDGGPLCGQRGGCSGREAGRVSRDAGCVKCSTYRAAGAFGIDPRTTETLLRMSSLRQLNLWRCAHRLPLPCQATAQRRTLLDTGEDRFGAPTPGGVGARLGTSRTIPCAGLRRYRTSHPKSYFGHPGADALALRDLVERAVGLAGDLLEPRYATFLRRWVATENVAAVAREMGRDRSHLSRDYRPRVVMAVTDVFMKLTGSGEHRDANTRPRRSLRSR